MDGVDVREGKEKGIGGGGRNLFDFEIFFVLGRIDWYNFCISGERGG